MNDIDVKIQKLNEILSKSNNIVFFGGAGVSTESGIPDFRSVDGLYNQKYKYPPETILSSGFFYSQTDEFYRFYRDKMLCLDAKPNSAHIKLAEMEQKGKLSAVITQNIDGLHQMAGSKGFMSFTALYTETTVKNAANCLMPNICLKARAYPTATAEELLNPMWCYTVSSWTITP